MALAFMYLGILFARENWPDLVPDDDLSTWNITPVRLVTPRQSQPKLRYFVRRLRNSLGHGTPTIQVPSGITPETMASAVTVTFKDENPKDPNDTFEAELTLEQAFGVAKMLHKTVVEDAAKRYGVSAPPTRQTQG